MDRIVIEKRKIPKTAGYRYILECLTCHKHFEVIGGIYNKGRGKFCSKKCRAKSKEWRKLLSDKLKEGFKNGRKHPRGMLGKQAWNKGKENPYWKGEKNPNWNNGSSLEEYGDKFNKRLKLEVKKRDGNKCKECNKKNCELVVHHIDYNKKNNDVKNLITLCRVCHSKTNFNRSDWKLYFKGKIK